MTGKQLHVMSTPQGVWLNTEHGCVGRFLPTGYDVWDKDTKILVSQASGRTTRMHWMYFLGLVAGSHGYEVKHGLPSNESLPMWLDDLP